MSWAALTCSSCTCTERCACACAHASAVHLVVACACSAAACRVCTLTRANAQLPVECTEADAMHAMYVLRFAHDCSAERTSAALSARVQR